MSKATIDKRKGVTVVVAIFSLLLLPMLALNPRGFDPHNFVAMAQEQEAASSSSSNQLKQ
jgi:hypothetical protein